MATTGLSQQDIKDLQEISTHLQAGDPRQKKISILLNSAPTQFEQDRNPDNQSGGFLSTAASDLAGAAKGLYQQVQQTVGNTGPGGWQRRADAAQQQMAQQQAEDDARKASGRSLPYRVAAAVAPLAGVNATGMEQAADVGNNAAILGHAAAAAAPAVAPHVVRGAGEVANAALRQASDVAPRLYQSALKPRTTLDPAVRENMLQAGLDNKIPVSESGFDKLHGLISDLQSKVSAVVASDPTATVNKYAVARRLNSTASRFGQQVAPSADLNTIANVGNDFLDTNPSNIPAADAQAQKVGTYQQLKSRAYGEVKAAQVESEKALTRGIKEELEKQFPELKNLNAQEGKLLQIEPTLSRALGRISNHEVLGIGTPIAAGTATALTGSSKLGAVLGTLKAVIDNPMVKSKLAIALNKAGRGSVPMSQAIDRIAAYSAGLAANGAGQGQESDPNQ